MKFTLTFAAVLAVAFAFASTPLAHSGSTAATKKCGKIGFTPDSDDLASNIRATGLTCGLARDFVRDSRGEPGARFRGFSCTSTAVDAPEGLPYKRYRCTAASDAIRWRRY